MKITSQTLLLEIQEKFSKIYPGLKLEFYSQPHLSYESSDQAEQIDTNITIEEVSKSTDLTVINFPPHTTVKELEERFENMFGLHVQVFRRSKDLWLQTSTTDDWTLDKQNRKGEESIQPKSLYVRTKY